VLGGLTGWFYYFMPLGIALFVWGTSQGRKISGKKMFLAVPVLLVGMFLVNIAHFYFLNGSHAFADLRGAFSMRASAHLNYVHWLARILWVSRLEFTLFFLVTGITGAVIFFAMYRKHARYALLLPLFLMPVLNMLVFRQWSMHPFGMMFFLPVVSVFTALLFKELSKRTGYLGVAVVLCAVIAGGYLSWSNLDFLYHKFTIFGTEDIQLFKSLKDDTRIGDGDLCMGREDAGIAFGGIVEWYLAKKIQYAPDCFSRHEVAALVFKPSDNSFSDGSFYEKELHAFEAQHFDMEKCADKVCLMRKHADGQ